VAVYWRRAEGCRTKRKEFHQSVAQNKFYLPVFNKRGRATQGKPLAANAATGLPLDSKAVGKEKRRCRKKKIPLDELRQKKQKNGFGGEKRD